MADFSTILDVLSRFVSPPAPGPSSVHVVPQTPTPPPSEQPSTEVPPLVAAQNDPASDFLSKVGQIESNNDDQARHAVIKQGINKGTRAVGRYGLTPLTIISTLRAMQQGGQVLPGAEDLPVVSPTESRSLEEEKKGAVRLASQLTPEQTTRVAYFLAQQVLDRANGDQERAALMWNSGINIPQKRITGALLDQHPYVQRFRKLEQQRNPGVPQMVEETRVRPGAVASTEGENVFQTQRLLDEAMSRKFAKRYKER